MKRNIIHIKLSTSWETFHPIRLMVWHLFSVFFFLVVVAFSHIFPVFIKHHMVRYHEILYSRYLINNEQQSLEKGMAHTHTNALTFLLQIQKSIKIKIKIYHNPISVYLSIVCAFFFCICFVFHSNLRIWFRKRGRFLGILAKWYGMWRERWQKK